MNDLLDILTVVGVATKPLWVWIRESPLLRNTKATRSASAESTSAKVVSEERSELFDEIRRITSELEFGRRDLVRARERTSRIAHP